MLDSDTFSKSSNNFPRKLQAIINSIQNCSWNSPASFVATKQQQKNHEINSVKQKLFVTQSRINYCIQMMEFYSNDNLQPERLKQLKSEKAMYESELSELKAQLSACVNPEQYRSRLDGGETTFTQNNSASTSAANRL